MVASVAIPGMSGSEQVTQWCVSNRRVTHIAHSCAGSAYESAGRHHCPPAHGALGPYAALLEFLGVPSRCIRGYVPALPFLSGLAVGTSSELSGSGDRVAGR